MVKKCVSRYMMRICRQAIPIVQYPPEDLRDYSIYHSGCLPDRSVGMAWHLQVSPTSLPSLTVPPVLLPPDGTYTLAGPPKLPVLWPSLAPVVATLTG
jgi:hypothetical protein